MTKQPKMTLPNGDVLGDGDWGRTREGGEVQVRFNSPLTHYPWATSAYSDGNRRTYRSDGCLSHLRIDPNDIIGRATSSASTRPVDEMDLTQICKPFGMLHADTRVALQAWPHGMECFQDECFQDWWEHPETDVPSNAFTYRAKPAPITIRAKIPWGFLRADIKWVAMDKSGVWFAYGDNVGGAVWRGHTVYILDAIVFPQGNEHWENTIQHRPL